MNAERNNNQYHISDIISKLTWAKIYKLENIYTSIISAPVIRVLRDADEANNTVNVIYTQIAKTIFRNIRDYVANSSYVTSDQTVGGIKMYEIRVKDWEEYKPDFSKNTKFPKLSNLNYRIISTMYPVIKAVTPILNSSQRCLDIAPRLYIHIDELEFLLDFIEEDIDEILKCGKMISVPDLVYYTSAVAFSPVRIDSQSRQSNCQLSLITAEEMTEMETKSRMFINIMSRTLMRIILDITMND